MTDVILQYKDRFRKPPQLGFNFGELIVDNFAGGGGASTGIEAAMGRPVDIAINHDPAAVAMHEVNHPGTKHYCESVWDIDPRKVCDGRPVGLAWFSPDCFPAGTMILTDTGYRRIEEIRVGDLVLTHKSRWKKVTETHGAHRHLVEIRGHGHPGIIVSPEHPFYARQRTNVWNNDIRQYRPTFTTADWAPASVLDKGWYWSTPTVFEELPIPAFNIPNKKTTCVPIDHRLMWLAGRYLGDGWSRISDTRAELVIICGKKEADAVGKKLDVWPRVGRRVVPGELAWQRRELRTAIQFTTNSRAIVEWLRTHFGHGAESKRVPGWALGMPDNLKQALLAGYLGADGWDEGRFYEAITISKALAFGIKALTNSLGKTVAVYRNDNPNTIIEGRVVSAKPHYKLRWRHSVDQDHKQTFTEDNLEWCPIREQVSLNMMSDVFNIAVEDDESYVAEGIVVHNCKHFSKAKGGKPVEKKIRGLAWVVMRWAATVRPRIIMLENVEEFITWGPLKQDKSGNSYPCPKNKGRTFKSFINALNRHGYEVEFRELRACDYGAPTIRKRLFLIARCDNQPIIWPEATHADPRSEAVKSKRLLPWRTAAECIDFTIPCPSIFERTRPLAEATLRRIAKGIMRYVVDNPEPFIVPLTHHGKRHNHNIKEPFRTITGANRGELALITPLLTEHANASSPRCFSAEEPLRTQCASVKGGHFAVVTPFISTYYGAKSDNDARGAKIDQPIATQTTENRHAVVSAFLAKHYGGVVGSKVTDPTGTVTTIDHHSVVSANLIRHFGESVGSSSSEPVGTITAGGFGKTGVVTSHLIKLRGTCADGQPVTEPAPTVTAGGLHVGEVRAFLLKYYGNEQDGCDIEGPVHTVTTKERFGLVTVKGEEYRIVDIGMRMLTPRELFRAQGFPENYIIDRDANGKPVTKTNQVARCGNSVCPPMSEVLVRANMSDAIKLRKEA